MSDTRIVDRLRVLPGGADMWLVAVTILYSFGKPIPWWAWVMLGLEVVLSTILGIKERMTV